MRSLIIICVVSLLVTLAVASYASASWSYDTATVYGPYSLQSIYWDYPWDKSIGEVEDSMGGYDYDSDSWDGPTYAYAEIASAYGEAETGYLGDPSYREYAWAQAYTEPPAGLDWAWAGASAEHGWGFWTYDAGTYTFSMDYQIDHELHTDYPGDWALAGWKYWQDEWGEVGIELWVYDGDYQLVDSNQVFFEHYVENGDSGLWSDSGTLYVTGYFPADTYGWVDIWDWTYAEAHTVPVPGAIVLAGLGTGLVSWLRRRRTI